MAYNTGKKTYTILYVGEKSYITRGLEKKEFFPKPNHPFPFSKVKWSASKSLTI